MDNEYTSVSELGARNGQDHHKAVLTDVEVEALICDRGPEDSPLMSYTQLARKYGVSKSSVRDILIGRRRGQAKLMVKRMASKKTPQSKVRVDLRVTVRARAILHRMGGGAMIEKLAMYVDSEIRRAPTQGANVVMDRVLKRLGGVS